MKKIDLETLKTIALSEALKPALENDDPFAKVNKFITFFKIKEGKNKINVSLLYKIYTDWSPEPIGKLPFCKEFAKIFTNSETINNRVVYYLNYKPGGLVKKGQELQDVRKASEE